MSTCSNNCFRTPPDIEPCCKGDLMSPFGHDYTDNHYFVNTWSTKLYNAINLEKQSSFGAGKLKEYEKECNPFSK